MHAQRGITLTGFLVFAVLGIAALLLGFKIGPSYAEFYTIQKIFKVMADEPALLTGSRSDINVAFRNRANMDNIKAISHEQIEVTKDGNRIIFSAEYSVRVPLFHNLSVCMDFRPTSEK